MWYQSLCARRTVFICFDALQLLIIDTYVPPCIALLDYAPVVEKALLIVNSMPALCTPDWRQSPYTLLEHCRKNLVICARSTMN